jgi:hypothetical protein
MHYDFHFYMVTPEYRAEEMICEVIPGTPACYPEQTTASGKAFFELEEATDQGVSGSAVNTTDPLLVNMPVGFATAVSDAVMFMGMHAFDRSIAPLRPEDWDEPTLVFVTHDSKIICFEPMLPFHFVVGDTDHNFVSAPLEYVEQSIDTLPYVYGADFDASTKVSTVTFSGKSNVCKADFDAAKEKHETKIDSSSSVVASLFSGIMAAVMTITMLA